MMTQRENYLRIKNFQNPEWIDCWMSISQDSWYLQKDEITTKILNQYPYLFRGQTFDTNLNAYNMPAPYSPGRYTDSWGCVWENIHSGVEGQVIFHPLGEDAAFDSYIPPSEDQNDFAPMDWEAIKREAETSRNRGEIVQGNGWRLFDRMYFLRGFEQLMMDIAEDNPCLPRLIDMIWEQKRKWLKKWLDIGMDEIGFHTDIGTQKALMISPAHFRKYLKPMFTDLFGMCRKAGSLVHLSSDGNILDIIGDLVECGVTSHDPQYRACTLEGIKNTYFGKPITIQLDLDRQLFGSATPEELDEHVKTAVETLYRPEGGLTVFAGIAGEVSIAQMDALCKALTKYCRPRTDIGGPVLI